LEKAKSTFSMNGVKLLDLGDFQLVRGQGEVAVKDMRDVDPDARPVNLCYEACFYEGWRAGESSTYRLIVGRATADPKVLSFVNSHVGTLKVDSMPELERELFKMVSAQQPHPLLRADYYDQALYFDHGTRTLVGSRSKILDRLTGDGAPRSSKSPTVNVRWLELCQKEVPRLHQLFDPVAQLLKSKPLYDPDQSVDVREAMALVHHQDIFGALSAAVQHLDSLALFQRQKKANCPQCRQMVESWQYLNGGTNGYHLCSICFSSYFGYSASGNDHGSSDEEDHYERRMLVDSIVEVKLNNYEKVMNRIAQGGYRPGKYPRYPMVGDEIMRLYFASMMLSWDYFIESSVHSSSTTTT
jgi:hypothetical protein